MKTISLLLVLAATVRRSEALLTFNARSGMFCLISYASGRNKNIEAKIITTCANRFLSLLHPLGGSSTSIEMGLFDFVSKAFTNEEVSSVDPKKYGAPPDAVKATARHILVKTQEDASFVMGKLANGSSNFAALAKEYSTCPSGASGGSLGSFAPGTMVPEFDKVIFSPDTSMGTVIGPVQTKFGYHLIVVDKRTGGGDWY